MEKRPSSPTSKKEASKSTGMVRRDVSAGQGDQHIDGATDAKNNISVANAEEDMSSSKEKEQ